MNKQTEESTFLVDSEGIPYKKAGVAVTGKVINGVFKRGEKVTIIRQDGSEINSVIIDFLAFIRFLDQIEKGDSIGLHLADIKAENISPGDIIINKN